MYTAFYGFSERPFNLTADPRFVYFSEVHREALASLFFGIMEKRGLVVITGEAGTGKTTLVRTLQDHLSDKIRTAYISHTKVTFRELLKNVLFELGLPVTDDETFLLIDRLTRYLVERSLKGDTVALIIDEAQDLSEDVLEAIRLLSNLETRSSKLLQIVLVGQPELDVKLHLEGLRQIVQRVAIKRHLPLLNQKDSLKYMEHRLHIVGGELSKVFTPEAVAVICEHANGIPRLINVICDNALLIGCGMSRKVIDANIVGEALQSMSGETPTGETPTDLLVATFQAPRATRTQDEMLRKLIEIVTTRKGPS